MPIFRASVEDNDSTRLLHERLAALEDDNQRLRARLANESTPAWHLLDACLEGILIHQEGVIRYANPGTARIFGYASPAELVGKPLWETLVAPEEWPWLQERTRQIMQGQEVPLSRVWRGCRRTGASVWIQARGTQVAWEGTPAILGVFLDVTDRVHDAETQRKQHAFNEVLIQTAAEGICVCRPCAELPHIRFSVWNERMTQLTGYSMDEINRLGWYQTMYPDPEVRALAIERMDRMRAGDNLGQEEWKITRKDGTPRVLAISTQLLETVDGTAVVALMQDVTDRRRVEADLRESEACLRLALHGARMISFAVDLTDGSLQLSEDLAAFFHLSPEQLGEPPNNVCIIHPDDRSMVVEAALRSLESGGGFRAEFRGAATAPDGGVTWYVSRGSVLADADGRPTRLVGVTSDITERKRNEERQHRFEMQLHETQKLESLGVLAGGIAHDFNNLLTGMLGFASVASREVAADSPVHGYLNEIEQAAQRAADLCQQMLAYAGRGRFVLLPLDVSTVVREAAGLLQFSIPKKARLELHLTTPLPPIIADPTQLRQVVMNLVMNAAEALPDGVGLVTLSTRQQQLDRTRLEGLELGATLLAGKYICLEVTDNGFGMEEATRQRMFEPFFTTKFTGRGLGLSAVLGIVRGHNGALEVHSHPGRGTTFRLYFPVHTASPVTPAGDHAAEQTVKGSGTILVADDEPVVRHVTTRMLESMGFTVHTANDGVEALEELQRRAGTLQMVLLDLTMPRLSGEEVLRQIQQHWPQLPVILMSGYSMGEISDRFADLGIRGFLQKPFRRVNLEEQLARALAP